jgi:RNA polymerase sigma factor (sigma-70 family)
VNNQADQRTAGGGLVPAIVLFGDVVDSRRAAAAASAWLRQLCFELEGLYGEDRLASFAFTQGDELQGLLLPTAEPIRAVMHASLHASARPMRWAVVRGMVERGEGPATEWGGDAFVQARELIETAKRQRDGLLMVSGDPRIDQLLGETAPVLSELLRELSPRQRTVARLALLEGLRQAEVAERLAVSRATVSVTSARARVRSIERMAAAVTMIFRTGVGAVGA